MIPLNVKADCCGCTACASICSQQAIVMYEDIEGFLYPNADTSKCTECGLCEKVCPIIHRDTYPTIFNKQNLYACHHKNERIWQSSSSGGIFSALTEHVFSNGGVVYGAMYDEDFVVVHRVAESEQDSIQFRGSKYSQSNLRGIYPEIKERLKRNQLVLFSGTPCQVEGLKSFLRKSYSNLITVDLLCHCIPSPKVFRDYVSFLKKKYKSDVSSVNMKDKTNGWTNQSLRLTLADGTTRFGEENTRLWNKLFYSHTIARPSCHSCRFSNINRPGDITIGDYWGIENVHPEFFDQRGISLFVTNTPQGEHIFEAIKDNVEYIKSDISKALTPKYVYTTTPSPIRQEFWKYYHDHGFEKTIQRFYDYGRWNAFKRNFRDKIHTLKLRLLK